MQPNSKTLVVFDFDGTLNSKDSLFQFIPFYSGKLRTFFGLTILTPFLIGHFLGLVTSHKAKEQLLTFFFAGENVSIFNKRCEEFAIRVLSSSIRPEAKERLDYFKLKGARIIIVSASIENYLNSIAKMLEVEVLGTRLEINESLLTGKILGNNCKGNEKVRRLNEFLNLDEYENIIVFGDSPGDKELINIATESYYRPFR